MKHIKTMITLFFILGVLALSNPAYAENAQDVVANYFDQLKKKDYRSAAAYFDPAALSEFRQTMQFVLEIPPEPQKAFFSTFFGAEATAESVDALSDVEYFTAFFSAIMNQATAVGAVDFANMKILGAIMEGTNISHVVTRNKVSVGEMEMESMEVVSLKKNGKDWKVLMSGKMKGVASQLRAAFDNQPPQ